MIVAADIMSEDVEVIGPDMLISQVAHLMLRGRVSGFPVVDQSAGMIGVITLTDLFGMLGKAMEDQSGQDVLGGIPRLKNSKVGDVMTRKVISIHPHTTLDQISLMVVSHGIHFFPVVEDDGRMVGIVSRHDILNAVFSYE